MYLHAFSPLRSGTGIPTDFGVRHLGSLEIPSVRRNEDFGLKGRLYQPRPEGLGKRSQTIAFGLKGRLRTEVARE
jgi:hypothetical protein